MFVTGNDSYPNINISLNKQILWYIPKQIWWYIPKANYIFNLVQIFTSHLNLQLFQITQLKIEHNPFAKGFREPGTATQAAEERHESKDINHVIIALDSYGAPPFLAAGGTIQHTQSSNSKNNCEFNIISFI